MGRVDFRLTLKAQAKLGDRSRCLRKSFSGDRFQKACEDCHRD
jgi:hypothetical protein